ncbi:uncharacterized protein LOC135825219 [Sycon ciliatum]|uniref:uncharacterized protein LOC135825219 n=1 Tax=Sycon ciliatum TaxID=27933 RepID=UPI0031F69D16
MGKDKKTSGLREDDKTSQMFLVECCRNNLLKALCEMMSTPDKMIRQKFLEAQYYQHPSIPLPIYLLWVAHSSDSRSVSDFLKDTFQHCMTEQERNDPGSAILLLASSTGDVEVAELLLDAEVSPDCHDEFGRSALHVASQEGHCRCVSVLLEKGADIDFCDKTGHTALHYACNAKRDDIVKVLCEAGADPNLADVNGYTPLHLSSMRGNAECIKDLHAAKADLGKTNERGRTPLHYTCMRGYADCTKVLCKAKANLDCTDKYDMTPVDYVVTRKRGDAMMTLQIVLSFMVTMLEAFTCLSLLVKAREMMEEEEESAALQNTIIKCISKVPYNVKDDSLFVPLYALTEEHFCQLLRASLRRYQLHPLLLEAFMRRRMKSRVHHSPLVVRLLGPPGGGKTSLVMSLLRIRTIWMRIVNYFSGDQGDSIMTARTKGIQRSNSPDESIVYLDLGGQYRYMASHQWLTGYSDVPVLNILTVSSVASKEEVRRQLRQWCDFIACRVKAGVANKSKLLIVATRRDSSTKAQRDVISAEVKLLKKVLKDHFEFQGPSVLFVNAIDQECFGVANLREAISKVKDEVTQGMQGDVPFAEYYLDNVRSQANQALTVSKSEFTKCLVKAILSPDFVLDSRSVQLAISSMQRIIDIEKSLYDLHKTAKLFYFPRTQSGVAKPRDIDDGLVVLEPVWLMSDITKKLYSPPDYLPLFITCNEVGFAKRDEVEQVLGHDSLISGREALNIAHKLGMCHITDDGVQVMIMPAQAENRA